MINRFAKKSYIIILSLALMAITAFTTSIILNKSHERKAENDALKIETLEARIKELENVNSKTGALMIAIGGGVSMEPTIMDGSILIMRPATDDNLSIGQIVTAEFDVYGDGSKLSICKRIARIDENGYFLIGDNAERSLDSRSFGYVQREDIKNVVLYIARYVYIGP